MRSVKNPDLSPPATAAARTWVGAVLALAVVVFLVGGGAGNFRPVSRDLVTEDTPIPVGLSPEGVQEAPPTEFRWTPGGEDADLTQLVLYRADRKRLWQSAPLRGAELEVPLSAYEHIPAGETLYCRVREVRRGKPRATSALVAFWFRVDLKGRGPGEGVRTDIMRQ